MDELPVIHTARLTLFIAGPDDAARCVRFNRDNEAFLKPWEPPMTPRSFDPISVADVRARAVTDAKARRCVQLRDRGSRRRRRYPDPRLVHLHQRHPRNFPSLFSGIQARRALAKAGLYDRSSERRDRLRLHRRSGYIAFKRITCRTINAAPRCCGASDSRSKERRGSTYSSAASGATTCSRR